MSSPDPAPDSQPWTPAEWRVLALATLGAVAMRVVFGGRGFWLDEYWTLHAA